MSSDEDHFTLGDFFFALEFVCPARLGVFAWAGFLGLALPAFRPFSSCCCFLFFLGFCGLKTEHSRGWMSSQRGFCQHSLWIHQKGDQGRDNNADLQFRLFARRFHGNQLWDFFVILFILLDLLLSLSKWFCLTCDFLVALLRFGFSCLEHTSQWFDALKQWLFLSWKGEIKKSSWPHFFLGCFCSFLRLLQQLEVAQIGRVDGEGDWRLTLYVDDLNHWFLLQRNRQMAQWWKANECREQLENGDSLLQQRAVSHWQKTKMLFSLISIYIRIHYFMIFF